MDLDQRFNLVIQAYSIKILLSICCKIHTSSKKNIEIFLPPYVNLIAFN